MFEAASRIELASPYEQTLFRQERGVAFIDIDRYLSAQADLVKSPDVLARASRLLKGDLRPGQIGQHVRAETSTKVLEVTVRARFGDPVQAADVVNAVTQAYQEVAAARVEANVKASVAELRKLEADLRRRLKALAEEDADARVQSEQDSLSEQLATLQTRAGQIRADAAVYGAGIERVDRAFPPQGSVSDSPRRDAVIFGLLGFIVALVGAFWRSERIQVIDSSDDAAGAVAGPLLGVLPRHPSDTATEAAPVVTAPDSAAAREHQFIASNLTLVARESESRVLLVTSPEAGQAKSITALNLALSAAQDQRSSILLDVDASGVMTSLLGAEGHPGVSDLLARSSADADLFLSDCVAIVYAYTRWRREGRGTGYVNQGGGIDGLRFVPLGTGAAYGQGAAASPQMAKVLAQLQQEADLIVVDGPPLLENPGAMKVAAAVDGVVLIVRRGTTLDELRQTRLLLQRAKAPVIGFVFDRSRRPSRWLRWSMRKPKNRGDLPAQ